jgi:hypothetical protein
MKKKREWRKGGGGGGKLQRHETRHGCAQEATGRTGPWRHIAVTQPSKARW